MKVKFADSPKMSAKEKERVYKCFKRVIENRDITLIDKRLYQHLYLHCGFIAHYDIHGFRAAYSDRGFLEFIDHFLNPSFNLLGPTALDERAIELKQDYS